MINTLPKSLIEAARKILTESHQHPMIDVDGELKHRHNSNGVPIHHTDEGIKNFHKWFDKSKAVDEHGRPQVFHHGTTKNFNKFDPSKSGEKDHGWYGVGHYFTPDTSTASAYSTYSNNIGANVMPVYLKLHQPYKWTREIPIKKTKEDAIEATEGMKSQGYDGVFVENEHVEPQHTKFYEAVVFHPHQIKSALGNTGKFNPSSHAITESSDEDLITNFRKKWQDAGVDNFVSHSKYSNTISLSSVKVPQHKQRQGIGSLYMKDLNSHADKLGATVTLSPATDFGSSKSGLLKFYKSHGFVENKGRNKDYTISDSMYRSPMPYKEANEVVPEKIEPSNEKPLSPIKDTGMSKHLKNGQFHKWFEGSKVKTGMGDPVIVYHGTPDIRGIKESGEFKEHDGGIFFTNDPKTAKSYADPKRASDYQGAEPGVISAHLNIKNPYYHDHGGKEWFGTDKIIADAKAKGHDGVIINNVIDHYNQNATKKIRPSTVYVAFKSGQIKHAHENTGDHTHPSNIYK